ncbi:MAG: hypothetical protein QXX68_03525 [Candidatus Pacearchaeota archaeon]
MENLEEKKEQVEEAVYLSVEVYNYLKPQFLTICGTEEREYDGVRFKYLVLTAENNIKLLKRINKKDQNSLKLIEAKHGTIQNKKVKVIKDIYRGRDILYVIPYE